MKSQLLSYFASLDDNSSKQFFLQYLELHWRHNEKFVPSVQDLQLIKTCDPSSQYTYIEETGSNSLPFVWRIKAWQESYNRRLLTRIESEVTRRISARITERENKIAEAMSKKTGMAIEAVRLVSMPLAQKTNSEIAIVLNAYGIDVKNFADILTRDEVLKEFEKEINIPDAPKMEMSENLKQVLAERRQ